MNRDQWKHWVKIKNPVMKIMVKLVKKKMFNLWAAKLILNQVKANIQSLLLIMLVLNIQIIDREVLF